jgi:hypothetical protein
MPTSEARIQANRQNAAHSTGPRTEAGKERSRRNSLKHGLTGEGIVLTQADANEVDRREIVFADELIAVGEVGQILARRAALCSVRMERAADQQAVSLTAKIREVEADFVAPEGVDPAEADRLKDETIRAAMFDPSKEATLARQYEAAAERGFYRALKELRQMDRDIERQETADSKAQNTTNNEDFEAMMASFLEMNKATEQMDIDFDAMYHRLSAPLPDRSENLAHLAELNREFDVPMTIGRGR